MYLVVVLMGIMVDITISIIGTYTNYTPTIIKIRNVV